MYVQVYVHYYQALVKLQPCHPLHEIQKHLTRLINKIRNSPYLVLKCRMCLLFCHHTTNKQQQIIPQLTFKRNTS